jgi:hypothetical protein
MIEGCRLPKGGEGTPTLITLTSSGHPPGSEAATCPPGAGHGLCYKRGGKASSEGSCAKYFGVSESTISNRLKKGLTFNRDEKLVLLLRKP